MSAVSLDLLIELGYAYSAAACVEPLTADDAGRLASEAEEARRERQDAERDRLRARLLRAGWAWTEPACACGHGAGAHLPVSADPDDQVGCCFDGCGCTTFRREIRTPTELAVTLGPPIAMSSEAATEDLPSPGRPVRWRANRICACGHRYDAHDRIQIARVERLDLPLRSAALRRREPCQAGGCVCRDFAPAETRRSGSRSTHHPSPDPAAGSSPAPGSENPGSVPDRETTITSTSAEIPLSASPAPAVCAATAGAIHTPEAGDAVPLVPDHGAPSHGGAAPLAAVAPEIPALAGSHGEGPILAASTSAPDGSRSLDHRCPTGAGAANGAGESRVSPTSPAPSTTSQPVEVGALELARSARRLSYVPLPDLLPPPEVRLADGADAPAQGASWPLADLPAIVMDEVGAGWAGRRLAELDELARAVSAQRERLRALIDAAADRAQVELAAARRSFADAYEAPLAAFVRAALPRKKDGSFRKKTLDLLAVRLSLRASGGRLERDGDAPPAEQAALVAWVEEHLGLDYVRREPRVEWARTREALEAMDPRVRPDGRVEVHVGEGAAAEAWAVVPGVRCPPARDDLVVRPVGPFDPREMQEGDDAI